MLNIRSTTIRNTGCVFAMLATMAFTSAADNAWKGWGGPNGNFRVDNATLPSTFPADGPKQLWSRDFAGGYSSIAVADGVAYILGRDGDDEIVLAVDARSGDTKWQHRYAAPVPLPELTEEEKNDRNRQRGENEYIPDFGLGPNSTPLIADDRIITIGFMGDMYCFDKAGKVQWQHDFIDDYKMQHLGFGYSASPIQYKDSIIALVGGKDGYSVVAFNLSDGKIRWHKHDWAASYGSPTITKIGDRDVLLSLVGDNIVALDPSNGDLLWKMEHMNRFRSYIATPIVCENDRVFIGTSGQDGSLMLQFKWEDNELKGEQIWTSKMHMAHQNGVRMGDKLLTSRMSPECVVLVDLKDGEFGWNDRKLGFSNFVAVGDAFLALQQNGTLRILRPNGDGMKVAAEAELLSEPSWTPPTVVGDLVLLRDKEKIVALDMSAK